MPYMFMASTQEVLLTTSQMKAILAASSDPQLKDPFIMHTGTLTAGIRRVSPIGELIFVSGNEYTGIEHITARHNYFSLKATWQRATGDGDQKHILEDPSRFRPGWGTYYNYVAIADAVYTQGVRDDAGNKRPELFDKYVGDFTYPDGVVAKHTLLLYKDTKIVHTLFPLKRDYNRTKVSGFHFRRGATSASQSMMFCTTTVKMPYYDHANKVRYLVEIIFDRHKQTQEILLWAYDKKENPTQYLSFGLQSHPGFEVGAGVDAMHLVQYDDLRFIEQAIKDTEKGLLPKLPETC
jgi:hypothetical protein